MVRSLLGLGNVAGIAIDVVRQEPVFQYTDGSEKSVQSLASAVSSFSVIQLGHLHRHAFLARRLGLDVRIGLAGRLL